MNRRSLGALIALNIALLAALALTLLAPEPVAGQGRVRPGEYVMVSGEVTGRGSQSIVYIIELKSSKMVAALFNASSGRLEVMDGRILNDDIDQVTTGR